MNGKSNEYAEENLNDTSIENYETQQIHLANDYLKRLLTARSEIQSLELPTIPKSLSKAKKSTHSKEPFLKTCKKFKEKPETSHKAFSTTHKKKFSVTILSPKKPSMNNTKISYAERIILNQVKPKDKPFLHTPLAIRKGYGYITMINQGSSEYKTSSSPSCGETRIGASSSKYEIYINPFKTVRLSRIMLHNKAF